MQYFILRKTTIGDNVEYETDYKAKKGFKTFSEAVEKRIALETLRDDDDTHIEFIIVNDGHALEEYEEKHSELVDRY
tara:strand:+ start:387 stop:617 length:231 start_codon:yes stop_codon:yes gene_type:complete